MPTVIERVCRFKTSNRANTIAVSKGPQINIHGSSATAKTTSHNERILFHTAGPGDPVHRQTAREVQTEQKGLEASVLQVRQGQQRSAGPVRAHQGRTTVPQRRQGVAGSATGGQIRQEW